MIHSVIKGVGGYVPEKVLSNNDLAQMVDTSDEWIRTRTGIQTRHIAAKDEYTSDLAACAGKEALERAGIQANELDMIIVATTTPDNTCPATATKVQQMLGMTHGFAFDVQAACSGFLYAIHIADQFIRQGTVKQCLVIGAETLSRIVDWHDRNTCVLFGDGAGAVVLAGESDSERGILAVTVHSDGYKRDLLKTNGGVSLTQNSGAIMMQGREVFRLAIECMVKSAEDILAQVKYTPTDVDWFIPHQANLRIIEDVSQKLSIPMDKVIVSVDKHGNTSAASIPLALWQGIQAGKIKQGDLLLLVSMGAGFTWGACLIRY